MTVYRLVCWHICIFMYSWHIVCSWHHTYAYIHHTVYTYIHMFMTGLAHTHMFTVQFIIMTRCVHVSLCVAWCTRVLTRSVLVCQEMVSLLAPLLSSSLKWAEVLFLTDGWQVCFLCIACEQGSGRVLCSQITPSPFCAGARLHGERPWWTLWRRTWRELRRWVSDKGFSWWTGDLSGPPRAWVCAGRGRVVGKWAATTSHAHLFM